VRLLAGYGAPGNYPGQKSAWAYAVLPSIVRARVAWNPLLDCFRIADKTPGLDHAPITGCW